jgi:hypothetical protein
MQTKIMVLPESIIKIPKLHTLNVQDTPLNIPPLICAERGIEAIKEFFMENQQYKEGQRDTA